MSAPVRRNKYVPSVEVDKHGLKIDLAIICVVMVVVALAIRLWI